MLQLFIAKLERFEIIIFSVVFVVTRRNGFIPLQEFHNYSEYCTRVKISHLVASLPTSCQQVVFALLVPSCQQVWNKLLTTCNNLVDIIRLVARLFQQVRYGHGITILLQPCVVNLVTFLLYCDCMSYCHCDIEIANANYTGIFNCILYGYFLSQ